MAKKVQAIVRTNCTCIHRRMPTENGDKLICFWTPNKMMRPVVTGMLSILPDEVMERLREKYNTSMKWSNMIAATVNYLHGLKFSNRTISYVPGDEMVKIIINPGGQIVNRKAEDMVCCEGLEDPSHYFDPDKIKGKNKKAS